MKYGIIGAMDVEVELLRAAMGPAASSGRAAGEALEAAVERDLVDAGQTPLDGDSPALGATSRVTCVAGRDFWEGAIDGTPCVVVQCGVGMVNAASCAQALIDRFAVDAVVNTGVGGSLDARIDIGDVVVATDAVNWLMDVENLGYAPGQTPGMDVAFATDDALRAAAASAARAEGVTPHEGRVASGDRFVRDVADKERIAAVFGARCCEMEGAAIAQVCAANDVPCAILRAISDKADGSDAVDYPVFEEAAARHCAAITRRLLARG
ncbi:MAG: 5'-methylthioadenosine/adenosylhomocysteine nucleosidase [Eggerthellaceae bacterium]|nr:5'-methylthioadenosine/adenosylhomocysteine nucleosidase [Eggerthellaceae bacterium]